MSPARLNERGAGPAGEVMRVVGAHVRERALQAPPTRPLLAHRGAWRRRAGQEGAMPYALCAALPLALMRLVTCYADI
jgi:hypothetical protein